MIQVKCVFHFRFVLYLGAWTCCAQITKPCKILIWHKSKWCKAENYGWHTSYPLLQPQITLYRRKMCNFSNKLYCINDSGLCWWRGGGKGWQVALKKYLWMYHSYPTAATSLECYKCIGTNKKPQQDAGCSDTIKNCTGPENRCMIRLTRNKLSGMYWLLEIKNLSTITFVLQVLEA